MTWRHHGGGTSVIVGSGAVDALPDELRARGLGRAFVVSTPGVGTGQGMRLVTAALASAEAGVAVVGTFAKVRPHPPEADIVAIAAGARDSGADVIVAVGGGSATDAAKGATLLAAGRRLEFDPAMLRGEVSEIPNLLPTVAVPTTLAGAEFTLGGAYTLEGHKLFFAGPGLPARLSVYDPRCLADTPADVLCSTGMNSLAHCLESAYTPSSSPYTRALGAAATAALTRWLPARAAGSTAPEVLSGLADGAVLGALAFVSGGGGVHHAICHVLGGVFGIPHGVANAVVLSYALAANESHSREVQADLAAVMGAELARRNIDGGRNLAENVRALRTVVHQPSTLRDLGVAEESIGSIADEVLEREPTLVTNPRPVTRELLVQILTAAWRGDLALAAA